MRILDCEGISSEDIDFIINQVDYILEDCWHKEAILDALKKASAILDQYVAELEEFDELM